MSIRHDTTVRSKTFSRAWVIWLFVLWVTLTGVGCSTLSKLPQEPGFDPRLTRFTYISETDQADLAVDTEATRLREDSKFIPLAVGFVNITELRATITRDSFTLIDDQGKRYPLASVQDVRSMGSLRTYDQRLMRNFRSIFYTRYSSWTQVQAVFFPINTPDPAFRGLGLLYDTIQVPKMGWFSDMLYFPHPEGILKGRPLQLEVKTPEMKAPVVVKFQVR